MSAGRFTTFLRIIAGWRNAYPAYKSHILLAIQNNHTEVWLELNVPLLLGTGGCGGCGSGIRTIAATGRRQGDPHCRTYGAHAGCGGTSCRNRRGSRPCRLTHLNGGGLDRSRRKRRYSPQAIQNFFHHKFPSLYEWRFTQKNFGRDRVYTSQSVQITPRGNLG